MSFPVKLSGYQGMSIRFIRILQRTSQFFWAGGVMAVAAAVLADHPAPVLLAVPFLVAGAALILFLIRVRCPVCHDYFAGRYHKHPFTRFCQHCGRHPGDWA